MASGSGVRMVGEIGELAAMITVATLESTAKTTKAGKLEPGTQACAGWEGTQKGATANS